jgi:hypothetical protein
MTLASPENTVGSDRHSLPKKILVAVEMYVLYSFITQEDRIASTQSRQKKMDKLGL